MEYFRNLFTAYTTDNNFLGYNFIDSLWIYPEKNKPAISSSCIQTYEVVDTLEH